MFKNKNNVGNTMQLFACLKHIASFLLGFLFMCLLLLFNGNQKSPDFNSDDPTDDLGTAALRLKHLVGGLTPSEGRSRKDGLWYGVKHPYEFYAYTAFYDDRRSLGSLPVIRIIVVAEYLDGRELHCLLYYKDKPKGHIVLASASDIGAGIIRHGKGFREYIVSCPLDSEDVPANVSVALTLAQKPDWLMPVEVALKPVTKHDFITCISVSYWKHNPYQIVEWMEMLKELGVSKVVVYNNSLNSESARIFQHYDQEGFIDFRQSWNFIPDYGEETIHMHMSPVINDCVYRYMHSTKMVVVTDLDELIIPKNKYTYQEMLEEIDTVQEKSTHPARQYMFRNAYFFLDIPHVDNSVSKHLITQRHRWRLPPSVYGYSTKSIISPLACVNMHNHFCWGATKLYDTAGYTVDVQPEYALNQHYKKCHLDMWEKPGACKEQIETSAVQDDAILRYKRKLTRRVADQLSKLNLDPL